ncbi:hypothetical protein OSB04_023615 [Centaurea solstitialis]|uniref:RNase III domain-containing protein n=1 Tax=Centaurea solstitialis TaxID=347529 RepID=A0AA38T466_9ASTR|nr:hypothetical protein OSB04_023615 [Centaurea solstitialis]
MLFLLKLQVRLFKEQLSHFPSNFTSMVDTPKILANVMEALVCTVFIDSDSSITTTLEVVEELLKAMFPTQNFPRLPRKALKTLHSSSTEEEQQANPKTQEITNKVTKIIGYTFNKKELEHSPKNPPRTTMTMNG